MQDQRQTLTEPKASEDSTDPPARAGFSFREGRERDRRRASELREHMSRNYSATPEP